MSKNFKSILIGILTVFTLFSSFSPVMAETSPDSKLDSINNSSTLLDFTSKRLLLSIDESQIREQDSKYIIASYHPEGAKYPTFLIQFETEKETQIAFAYYQDRAEFVDVDMDFFATETSDEPMTETENPFVELNNINEIETQLVNGKRTIALIDSGVGEKDSYDTEHVIQRVTVLSDPNNVEGWDDGYRKHGTAMSEYMIQENPDVQIISIKAMNSNERGQLSSIYSAIVYAVEHDVDIISLSLAMQSPKTSSSAQAFQQGINLATEKGIVVVAAAGNNPVDASGVIPCALDGVICVGSASQTGQRNSFSGYGDTVEYNVVSSSTSEATARAASIICKNDETYPPTVLNQGKFYAWDYVPQEEVTQYDVEATIRGTDEDLAAFGEESIMFTYSYLDNGDIEVIFNIDKSKINGYDENKSYKITEVSLGTGDLERIDFDADASPIKAILVGVTSNIELIVDVKVSSNQQELVTCWDGSQVTDHSLCPSQPLSYPITVVNGQASLEEAVEGTIVSIAADETEGLVFDHWIVVSGEFDPVSYKNSVTTFVMPKSPVTIMAVFKSACALKQITPTLTNVVMERMGTPGNITTIPSTEGMLLVKPDVIENKKFKGLDVSYTTGIDGYVRVGEPNENNEVIIEYKCAEITAIKALYETPQVVSKYEIGIHYSKGENSVSFSTGFYPEGEEIDITTAETYDIPMYESGTTEIYSYMSYRFIGWEVISGDIEIEDASSLSTKLTVKNSNATVKANYERYIDTTKEYKINVANSEVELSAPATARPGEEVEIITVLPEDVVYEAQLKKIDGFSWSWSPSSLEILDKSTPTSFVFVMPDSNVTVGLSMVTSEISEEPPLVKSSLDVLGGKIVEPEAQAGFSHAEVSEGEHVKIKADAEEGSKKWLNFAEWKVLEGTIPAGTDLSNPVLEFDMPNGPVAVEATFNPYCKVEIVNVDADPNVIFYENGVEVSELKTEKEYTMSLREMPSAENKKEFRGWEMKYHSSNLEEGVDGTAVIEDKKQATTKITINCVDELKITPVIVGVIDPPGPVYKCWDGSSVLDPAECPVRTKYKVIAKNGISSETEAYPGQKVTVTFSSTNPSEKFSKWSSEDIEITDETANPLEFIMPEHDVEIVGNAVVQKPPVTCTSHKVSVTDGTINGKAEDEIDRCVYGVSEKIDDAVIKANEAPAGYVFTRWEVVSGDVTFESATSMETNIIPNDINSVIKPVYRLIADVEPKQAERRLTIVDGLSGMKVLRTNCFYTITPQPDGSTLSTKCVLNLNYNVPAGYTFDKWEVTVGSAEIKDINSLTSEISLLADDVTVKPILKKNSSGNNNQGNSGNNSNNNQGSSSNNNSGTTNVFNDMKGAEVQAASKTTVNTGFESNILLYSSILLITLLSSLILIRKKSQVE